MPTPDVLQRQYDVFERRVSGEPLRLIADALGIGEETAVSDLNAEQTRRIQVLSGGNIANHVALSISRYEAVILRSLRRLANAQVWFDRGDNRALDTALLEERNIMDAQKRIDAVLGLERLAGSESKQPYDIGNPQPDGDKHLRAVAAGRAVSDHERGEVAT